MTNIETFSSGYLIVDAETEEYSGENVAVAQDLLEEFFEYTGLPYLKLGNQHFIPKAEWGIPPETVAIPKSEDINANDRVLLTKTEAAMQVAAAKEETGG